MAIVLKHCAMCSGPLELKTVEKLSVEDKPLAMTVFGMPLARCAKGHSAPVHRDFMLWLIRELKGRESSLPAATEQGMIFKKYLCSCGKELEAKDGGRKSFAYDLAYEGAPAFRVELDMPVYKCPGCGKEQLRSLKELQKATPVAIAGLNDAAGFPHSG
jgi:DNA-directed RNA polymerase subunit RPC12/RpoP